ncbi:ankyrin repeat domain-containing protein [Roseicyclus mahoneyensis]|uniref:Ketosteroid isomerase-like protein n=1 Tax=Roseicyclus mahoneyensis TaxID=164332 RepID=A0A316GKA2_9RHOB|nr:ankyrin repeat domain-containing protein [Roseicyclus mahoneyensis]PWK61485.1 ketosteroid isomerase-like protein [Roseicyclus mahoneyensis]
MSQEETRRIANAWFDALDRADYPAAIALLDESIEWVNLPKIEGVTDIIPWMGTAHGIEEVLAQFSTRNGIVDVKVFKPVDLVVEDNVAVGTVHDISTVLATGNEFEILFASWMEVRNGKIVKWKSYCDAAAVVAAFLDGVDQKLLDAVKTGDIEKVRTFLTLHKGNANVRDEETGLTLLMISAARGDAAIAKLLIEHGADVFTTDSKTGATALHKAGQGGSVEVAQLLLDAGAHIDAVTPTMGHTPIMDALWYKWPLLVEFLIQKGQNLNFTTHYGFTLDDHIAFETKVNQGEERKKVEYVKQAVDDARAKTVEQVKEQQLIYAITEGENETAAALIAGGADVNAVHPHINSFLDGHTPLIVAARDGRTDLIDALLNAGAEVDAEDWVFKGHPIHKATYNGNAEILRKLVAHPGIDLDVQGPINGYTPLHDALWHGFVECAEILIDAGARLDLRGHDGKTVLDISTATLGAESPVTKRIEQRLRETL